MRRLWVVVAIAACWMNFAQAQSCIASSCSGCTAGSTCGWCAATSSCSTGGASGPTTGTCAYGWSFYSADCSDSCRTISSCSACSNVSSCGWCSPTRTCFTGTDSGASGARTCVSPQWIFNASTCPACSTMNSCSLCTLSSGCGWCATRQVCLQGTAVGPSDASSCDGWNIALDACAESFVGSTGFWVVVILVPLVVLFIPILVCVACCTGCCRRSAKVNVVPYRAVGTRSLPGPRRVSVVRRPPTFQSARPAPTPPIINIQTPNYFSPTLGPRTAFASLSGENTRSNSMASLTLNRGDSLSSDPLGMGIGSPPLPGIFGSPDIGSPPTLADNDETNLTVSVREDPQLSELSALQQRTLQMQQIQEQIDRRTHAAATTSGGGVNTTTAMRTPSEERGFVSSGSSAGGEISDDNSVV